MQPTLRQHAARWLSATALGAALSLPLAHTAAASETLPPSLEQMQEIYLAFYLRPGDPGGLIYWAGVAARDFATVLTDFGRAEEARRLYGDINHATIGNAIDKIYMALFNALPDEAGKQYYIDGFMAGRFSAADLAYRILKGAQDGARPDLTAVRNKMAVANHFVRILDPELDGYDIQATYNAADEAPVREWMRKVTGTHTYSREQVREFIMNYVASANDPIRQNSGSKPMLVGRFVDSAVENIDYKSGDFYGKTDSNGYFYYHFPGAPVEFLLGGKVIGTALAAPVVNIYDLERHKGLSSDKRERYALRVAQLLQTLDEDGNPDNGIKISDSVKSIIKNENHTIDFYIEAGEWERNLKNLSDRAEVNYRDMGSVIIHLLKFANSYNCSTYPDVLYPSIAYEFSDKKISSAGRSCRDKAEMMAFYNDVAYMMGGFASSILNNEVIVRGDVIWDRSAESFAKNNIARVALDVSSEIVSLTKGLKEEQRKAIVAASARILNQITKFVVLLNEGGCSGDKACLDAEDILKQSAWVTITDGLANASECVNFKSEKCAAAIFDLLTLGPLKNSKQKEGIKKALVDYLATFDKLIESGSSPGLIGSTLGSFISNIGSTVTGYYFLDEDDVLSSRDYIVKSIYDYVDVYVSCVTMFGLEPVIECGKKITGYVADRVHRLVTAPLAYVFAEDAKRDAHAILISMTYIQERMRWGGEMNFLREYNYGRENMDLKARRAIALRDIAERMGKPLARFFGTKIDLVEETLSVYESILSKRTADILSGRDSFCSNLGFLGTPKSPQMRKVNGVSTVLAGEAIDFIAPYENSDALHGFLIDFGDGNLIESDVPVVRHVFNKGGLHAVFMTPRIRQKGRIVQCPQRRVSKVFNVEAPAKITGLEPARAEIGRETQFTIVGENLPSTATVVIDDAVCSEPVNVKTDGTGFQQICVIKAPAGNKRVGVYASSFRPPPALFPDLIANASVMAYEATRPEVDDVIVSNARLGYWGNIKIIGKNFPENVRIVVLGKKDVCRDSVVTGTTTVEVHCFFEVPGGRAVQVLVGEEAILESPFRFEILKDENPVRPEIDSMSPLSAKVGEVATFTFTGRNLTERVWFAIDGSNCFERNISSEQITMRCKLTKSGTLKVTAFEMGTAGNLGSWWLQVEPEDASPMVESLSPERVKIGVPTRFTVKGRNLPGNTDLFVDDALECGPHTASPHEVSRVCTLQGAPGSRAVRVTVGGNFLWMLGVLPFEAVAADTAPQPVPGGGGKIPHTGITAQQCYKKGSNALVACNSAEAIALSNPGKQDGMRGHINTMSYSEVPGFARTECVKDNFTGLMWEGKTNDGGLRDGSKRYTNYADGRAGSALDYVNQVNAQGLCGHHDWRLPTVDELHSLVDFSKPSPGPTIDTAWFPNTPGTHFWSGTPYAGHPARAWGVHFNNGFAGYDYRDGRRAVRLVRASQ